MIKFLTANQRMGKQTEAVDLGCNILSCH